MAHADGLTRACPAQNRCDAVFCTHAELLGRVVVALPCLHHLVALRPFSSAGFADPSFRLSEAGKMLAWPLYAAPAEWNGRRVARCLPVACLSPGPSTVVVYLALAERNIGRS
jgi:hypothetical protein